MSGFGIPTLLSRSAIFFAGKSSQSGRLIASRSGTNILNTSLYYVHKKLFIICNLFRYPFKISYHPLPHGSYPLFVLATIRSNFDAITRSNSSVTSAAAMAPNPAQRKVYVIGVGMTKVGTALFSLRRRYIFTYSHCLSSRNRDAVLILTTQKLHLRL